MSLTTEITGLTSEVRQLVNTVAAQDDLVRDKIAQLAAMVPNTARLLYVDGAQGSDNNDGLTAATALATYDEALRRQPPGGLLEVRLLTDVGQAERQPLTAQLVRTIGWDAVAKTYARRTLTPASVADNRSDSIAAVWSHGGGIYWLRDVDISLPAIQPSIVETSYFDGWRAGHIVVAEASISSGGSYLIQRRFGPASAFFSNVQFAGMDGLKFKNVPAGTDPNADRWITTNITQN